MVSSGGLHIIGTERHEARRIDNQLRGRAGRQGDPGSSRFYPVPGRRPDAHLRVDRIAGLMERLGMEEGVPIEHKMVTRAIERAQKQVEAQNFSVRKHLLEYDDVMNKQRENVYALRRELLEGTIRLDEDSETDSREVDTRTYLMTLAEGLVYEQVETVCGPDVDPEEWDLDAVKRYAGELFGLDAEQLALIDLQDLGTDDISRTLWSAATGKYEAKEAEIDPALLRRVERDIMLQVVDVQWRTTSTAWTTSRRASACAGTASATRSWSTSGRASRCSRG